MIKCATFCGLLWLHHMQFNLMVGVLSSRVPVLKVSTLGSVYILIETLPLVLYLSSRQVHQFLSVVGHLFAQWSQEDLEERHGIWS